MTAKIQSGTNKSKRWGPGPTAIGFVAAFLLSTATIIYTGLKVGAPREIGSPNGPGVPVMPLRRDADAAAERTHASAVDDDMPIDEKKPDDAPQGGPPHAQ